MFEFTMLHFVFLVLGFVVAGSVWAVFFAKDATPCEKFCSCFRGPVDID